MLGEVLASPPSDVEEFNPVTVSPGLPGFITMFLLAAVVVLLVLDMTRRVRRVQATERVEQRMAAEREGRSEEHTSELQSRGHLVCRLLLEKKKKGSKTKRSRGRQIEASPGD